MSNKLNRRFLRMGDLVKSSTSRNTHEVDVQPQVKTISGHPDELTRPGSNSVDTVSPGHISLWKAATKSLRKYWQLYLMMLPGLTLLLIFKCIPIANAVLAFKEYNVLEGIWGAMGVNTDIILYQKHRVKSVPHMEGLTDRQAAESVRSRIDWKYLLGLPLTDPGFHYSVLSPF